MSTQLPTFIGGELPASARIGIVAAKFNSEIVEELLRGCRARLHQLGVPDERIELARVPGAFEMPVVAKVMCDSGLSAVICLGCVVRGDTPHFDYVAGEAARGIQLVAIQTGKPVIFGLLTTNTFEQAEDRVDPDGPHGHAGERAAEAVVEMICVLGNLGK